MTDLCPLHCVNIACKQPSFLEQHETFILTIIGIGGSGLGVLLAYFLKSRCSKIKVCFGCLKCDRTPLANDKTDKIEPKDITINSDSVEISEIDQP